ncbi:MAG TPA: OpgC domain-containing protein [Candidatus Sulfotelmatobacter sp.]|nr:OpgC domain-containing protein [Candidatus Sulfotelmatobacter sp.]
MRSHCVPSSATRPAQRDLRVDLLRGFALLTIFIDHSAGNILSPLTLRNFGFCDAAELFVILAGFSATLAYGKCFARDGIGTGLRRIGSRCLRLYLFQAGLLLATLLIVRAWLAQVQLDLPDLAVYVEHGLKGLRHGLKLQALPANVDVLPLYIILLALFPLVHLGMRFSRRATLAISAAVWLAANLVPGLNMTNWLDGRGWFFNPFAWQFLFVLGAWLAAAMAERGGGLPRLPSLAGASWAYLAFAFLAAAPWAAWGLWDVHPIPMAAPDKTDLSLFRLLDILALVYLALTSRRFALLARSRWLSGIVACGQHSLEVFSLGTLLSLVGRLLFATFGTSLLVQLVVDGLGLGALLALAWVLGKGALKARAAALRPSLPGGA